MGGGASVKAKPRATTPEEVKILIREACNDKKKVEAVLAHIKDMRSEMSNKNIDIGESRLSRLHQVEEEKAELLNRLSSLASDRMRSKNPKIADLSDTNRPTKLTERFSELYDNEWTDAFTKLRDQYAKRDLNHLAERTAIEILLLILKVVTVKLGCTSFYLSETLKDAGIAGKIGRDYLKYDQNCYTTCKKIAKKQCQELGDKFFSPKEHEGPFFELRINECQKQIAQITYMDLQQGCKGLIEGSITFNEDKERIMEYLKTEPDLKYVKSCIELTWLMCIQAPPVILKFEPREKEISEYFRTYTKSGDKPDFVVWPVLFLHEKGPVLSKGVIQFK